MIFLLSTQKQFLYYIEFLCRRACEKQLKLEFLHLPLVSGSPKSGCFVRKFSMDQVLESLSDRNNSREPQFLDFVTVFHMLWKDQES